MWRRTIWLITTLAFGLLCAPSPSHAQSGAKMPRIGILTYAFKPYSGFEAFHRGLRDLGYVEGQTIVIESRFAAFSLEKLPDLVAELIRLKVDVIVALGGPAARAAQKATTTIPIVMIVGDALEQELVTNLARPGGNITGFTNISPDLSGKRLELLHEAVPQMSRVAVLWCPDLAGNPHSGAQRKWQPKGWVCSCNPWRSVVPPTSSLPCQ